MVEQTADVLNNATSELVYQLSAILISTVTTVIGVYLKNFLETNKYAIKYNLANEKNERILENAILYAERKAKEYTKDQVNKRELALKYIDMIDPAMIRKNGDKLELMIDRKVEQVIKK